MVSFGVLLQRRLGKRNVSSLKRYMTISLRMITGMPYQKSYRGLMTVVMFILL